MGRKILVDANNLRQLLEALAGPGHLIRELQVIARIDPSSPIPALTKEFNERITEAINRE